MNDRWNSEWALILPGSLQSHVTVSPQSRNKAESLLTGKIEPEIVLDTVSIAIYLYLIDTDIYLYLIQ